MNQYTFLLGLIFGYQTSLAFNPKPEDSSIIRQEALDKFGKHDYNGAIDLIKKALKERPNDAELYCDLGRYYHYRAYDSRPMINYNRQYSDSIISFLDKSISLKPSYREPFYWLHAEFGARALIALQNKDVARCKKEYQTAIKKGALPKWMLEWGRNALNSCEAKAILFTYGDIPLNAITSVQILENYRKDVTVIPIGFSARPGYVKLFKYGVKNGITSVKIRFSDEQIMDMRPYKWDSINLSIKIPENLKQKYKIENNFFQWTLAPDMTSEGSTILSPWGAFLSEIIEANEFERPIYFTNTLREGSLLGLLPFTINCGIVRKLVPLATKNKSFEFDNEVVEKVILNKNNFKDFKDIDLHDFPGNSNILSLYYSSLYYLADSYNKNGEKDKIPMILDLLKNELYSSSLNSDRYFNWINSMYKK
jgi:hypothetical protein